MVRSCNRTSSYNLVKEAFKAFRRMAQVGHHVYNPHSNIYNVTQHTYCFLFSSHCAISTTVALYIYTYAFLSALIPLLLIVSHANLSEQIQFLDAPACRIPVLLRLVTSQTLSKVLLHGKNPVRFQVHLLHTDSVITLKAKKCSK